MSGEYIDYGRLIDDAMHIIVKKALEFVCKNGLPGNHHFFISFLTNYPGVSISPNLKNKYPEEMTIVLQHQFENLIVEEKNFSVRLSFDNVKETIKIPFEALVAFADPGVKFGLQFRHLDDSDNEKKDTKFSEVASDKNKNTSDDDVLTTSLGSTNVVDLNSFRKNLKKD